MNKRTSVTYQIKATDAAMLEAKEGVHFLDSKDLRKAFEHAADLLIPESDILELKEKVTKVYGIDKQGHTFVEKIRVTWSLPL